MYLVNVVPHAWVYYQNFNFEQIRALLIFT